MPEVSVADAVMMAVVLPEHAANKSLAWSSSDEGVATVDNNGSISLIKKGTVADAVMMAVPFFNNDINPVALTAATPSSDYADANLMPDYYIVICDGKNIKVKVK